MSSSQAHSPNEELHHDRWASELRPEEVLVDEAWSAATCPEHRWIREQLGSLAGKRALDFGCGAGEAAVWFAKQGAVVTACDVSTRFLALVHEVAKRHGVQVSTCLADDPLPNATFDVVYAGNVLHHAGVEPVLERLHAALKPGGLLVSWDPLRHNPVINVYRRMAQGLRTEGEAPLDIADVARFRARFSRVHYQCFWLMTLGVFLRFYFVERLHPSKHRYWKKIIQDHERLTPLYRRLERVDRWLLGRVPFLGRYCWNIAVCARKADSI